MFWDLLAYSYALWHNWLLAMAGGPFLVDRLFKWFWSGYDDWFKKHRHRIVWRVSFAGFVLAGFLAFRSVLHTNTRLEKVLGDSASEWKPLSDSQEKQLVTELRPLIKPDHYITIGFVQNNSSIDLAEKLKDVFRSAGSQHASIGITGQEKENRYGITVYVKNPEHMSSRDAALIAAFRSTDLPTKAADIGDAYLDIEAFSIVVGYPPP